MGMVNNLLLETPNYEEGEYGLPVEIWIGSAQFAKHNYPRIKVVVSNEPVILTNNGICLRKENMTCKDLKLSSKDFKELCTWMIANRDIICAYDKFYNVTENINEKLDYALEDRYNEIQKNGIEKYLIPFTYTISGVKYDDNQTINIRNYPNIFLKYKASLDNDLNQEIKEYVINSGLDI